MRAEIPTRGGVQPRSRQLYRVTYPTADSTVYTPIPWGSIREVRMRRPSPDYEEQRPRNKPVTAQEMDLWRWGVNIVELPESPHIPPPPEIHPVGLPKPLDSSNYLTLKASNYEYDVVRSEGEVWFGLRLYEAIPEEMLNPEYEYEEYFLRTHFVEEDQATAMEALTPGFVLCFLFAGKQNVPDYHCWLDLDNATYYRNPYKRKRRMTKEEQRRVVHERKRRYLERIAPLKENDRVYFEDDSDDQRFVAPFAPSSYPKPALYDSAYGDESMDDEEDIGIEALHRNTPPGSVSGSSLKGGISNGGSVDGEESFTQRRTRLVDHYNHQIWNHGLAATILTLERYHPNLFENFVQNGLTAHHGTYPTSPPRGAGPGLTIADKLACLAFEEDVRWEGNEQWTGNDSKTTIEALAGPKPSPKPTPPHWKGSGSYEPPKAQSSDFLTAITAWRLYPLIPDKDNTDYDSSTTASSRTRNKGKNQDGGNMDTANPVNHVRIVKLYDGRKYTNNVYVPDKTETRLWVLDGNAKANLERLAAEIFGNDWNTSMEQRVQIKCIGQQNPVEVPLKNAAQFKKTLDQFLKDHTNGTNVWCAFLFPVKWDNSDWNGDMDVKMKAFIGGKALDNPPHRRTAEEEEQEQEDNDANAAPAAGQTTQNPKVDTGAKPSPPPNPPKTSPHLHGFKTSDIPPKTIDELKAQRKNIRIAFGTAPTPLETNKATNFEKLMERLVAETPDVGIYGNVLTLAEFREVRAENENIKDTLKNTQAKLKNAEADLNMVDLEMGMLQKKVDKFKKKRPKSKVASGGG